MSCSFTRKRKLSRGSGSKVRRAKGVGGMQPKSVTITGTGSVPGGIYRSVSIMGEAQLFGDIECESFKCTGNSHLKGSLTARKYRLQGEASVAGDLKAAELAS